MKEQFFTSIGYTATKSSKLCSKCKKAMEEDPNNADQICKKCQKALTKEKRMNMSELIERIDKLLIDSIVVGGGYIDGTTVNIIGSGQTRAIGGYDQSITVMKQKNSGNIKPVNFNSILGAFVPDENEEQEEK
jgi:hypothetical protein